MIKTRKELYSALTEVKRLWKEAELTTYQLIYIYEPYSRDPKEEDEDFFALTCPDQYAEATDIYNHYHNDGSLDTARNLWDRAKSFMYRQGKDRDSIKLILRWLKKNGAVTASEAPDHNAEDYIFWCDDCRLPHWREDEHFEHEDYCQDCADQRF